MNWAQIVETFVNQINHFKHSRVWKDPNQNVAVVPGPGFGSRRGWRLPVLFNFGQPPRVLMQLLLPSEDLAEAAEAKSEAVRRLEAAGQVERFFL